MVDAPELPLRLEIELPSGKVVTPWITVDQADQRWLAGTGHDQSGLPANDVRGGRWSVSL